MVGAEGVDGISRSYARTAGVAGLVLFMMLVLGYGILLSGVPEATAAARSITTYFLDHQSATQVGIVVVMLSMPFYLVFASGVLVPLRQSDAKYGENFKFGAAAGILGTAVLVELQGGMWGLLASGLVATSAPALLRPLFALGQQLHPVAGAFLVLWYASVGIGGLRHHGFPRSLCWLAMVLALVEVVYTVAAVGLGGSLFRAFDPVEGGLSSLWIVSASIWMLAGAKVRATEVSPR